MFAPVVALSTLAGLFTGTRICFDFYCLFHQLTHPQSVPRRRSTRIVRATTPYTLVTSATASLPPTTSRRAAHLCLQFFPPLIPASWTVGSSSHMRTRPASTPTAPTSRLDRSCPSLPVLEQRLADFVHFSQPLCLGITGQDCTSIHVVASGDGCWQIATDAGTDLTTLLANNPNVADDCSNIYPGEVSRGLRRN